MIIITASEFRNNFKKYFDIAEKETVVIQRTSGTFVLQKKEKLPEPIYNDPDLERGITLDELLVGIKEDIRKRFA